MFGWNANYESLVENGTVETLYSRREKALMRFAKNAISTERFAAEWFTRSENLDRETRPTTRNLYVEQKCRTERGKNNPIQVMTRMLNADHRRNL